MTRGSLFLGAAFSVRLRFATGAKKELNDIGGAAGSSSIMQRLSCYLAIGHDSRWRFRAPHTNNYKQCWNAKGRNQTPPKSPLTRVPVPACETEFRERWRADTSTASYVAGVCDGTFRKTPVSIASITSKRDTPGSSATTLQRGGSYRDHRFLLAGSATLWFRPPG